VDRNFDHVPKGSAIRLENRGNVVDGLVGLLFDAIAYHVSCGGVDGTGAGHENKISGAPSLGVGTLRGRAAIAPDFVFGHIVFVPQISGDEPLDKRDPQQSNRNQKATTQAAVFAVGTNLPPWL
jgi:hypothetical protein